MKIKATKKPTRPKKKKNPKAKQNETKSPQKYQGVRFVLADHSGTWGLPWSVVDIPHDSPIKKTVFSFVIRYQLLIESPSFTTQGLTTFSGLIPNKVLCALQG